MSYVLQKNPVTPSTYRISNWFFFRCLGLIYFLAFASLWPQLSGLIGAEGILPAHEYLEVVSHQVGFSRFWSLPTIFWLSHSDVFLHIVCGLGMLASLALVLGVCPALMTFLVWLFFLSFVSVSREFLSFQWDALLLEVGLLAIFFAPLQFLSHRAPYGGRGYVFDPPKIVVWAFWALLFKLMFLSGAVKLLSGDKTWADLTALVLHYETQPLPTWIGWYAHQLPVWAQKLSVGVMFAIELVIPFLIFGPRVFRLSAGFLFTFFMALIILTGNYCFFNWLTIALCLLLVEDAVWPGFVRKRFLPGPASATEQKTESTPEGVAIEGGLKPDPPVRVQALTKWITVPVVSLILCVSLTLVLRTVRLPVRWFLPGLVTEHVFRPFRSVNAYGLFAVMTAMRSEIVIEGSNDGKNWKVYDFKYKPQNVSERPRFVAPHQPRLDWQMWFAALGTYKQNPWFIRFMQRLLQGEPGVLRLLRENPFPDAPPRYVRAAMYKYHFTDIPTRQATGAWWRRERTGLYCPTLTVTKN